MIEVALVHSCLIVFTWSWLLNNRALNWKSSLIWKVLHQIYSWHSILIVAHPRVKPTVHHVLYLWSSVGWNPRMQNPHFQVINCSTWAFPDFDMFTGSWTIHGHQVQFSHSVVSNSLQPHGLQHGRLPCPSPTPRAYLNSCSLTWWYHPIISSSAIPSLLTFNLSQHQGLFQWVSSLHQVARILEFQLQHQSFQWTFRTDFL